MMTTTAVRRPSRASRKGGYVIAAVINAVLLWFDPRLARLGRRPFLTADFQQVLWLIDLSLVVTIALNLLYLIRDPRRLTTGRRGGHERHRVRGQRRMQQVFRSTSGSSEFWPMVFRVVLWVGIVGSAVAVIVNLIGRRPWSRCDLTRAVRTTRSPVGERHGSPVCETRRRHRSVIRPPGSDARSGAVMSPVGGRALGEPVAQEHGALGAGEGLVEEGEVRGTAPSSKIFLPTPRRWGAPRGRAGRRAARAGGSARGSGCRPP